MPPYDLIHAKDLMFMLATGLGLAIAVILARASTRITFSFGKPSDEVHEFGGGVGEGNAPVPVFIWLVFIGYFIWAAAYIVACGGRGV